MANNKTKTEHLLKERRKGAQGLVVQHRRAFTRDASFLYSVHALFPFLPLLRSSPRLAVSLIGEDSKGKESYSGRLKRRKERRED